MKQEFEISVYNDKQNELGEGPFYNAYNKAVSWIDITRKTLFIHNKVNEIKEITFNEKIGAAVPLLNTNGFIVCGEKTIFLYEDEKIMEYKNIDSLVDKGMRCNDAKVDSKGRLLFSTMMDDDMLVSRGGLYSLYNNEIKCLIKNTKLGNGMAWNHDGSKFFYADSLEHKVFSFDYDLDRGTLSNKRVLFEIIDGVPDGMTIDNNDNLFVAVWGGSRIEIRDSSDGKLLDKINMPTKLVTSCTFINDTYDELIVTTASINDNNENAGKVYKVKLSYVGKKENMFFKG